MKQAGFWRGHLILVQSPTHRHFFMKSMFRCPDTSLLSLPAYSCKADTLLARTSARTRFSALALSCDGAVSCSVSSDRVALPDPLQLAAFGATFFPCTCSPPPTCGEKSTDQLGHRGPGTPASRGSAPMSVSVGRSGPTRANRFPPFSSSWAQLRELFVVAILVQEASNADGTSRDLRNSVRCLWHRRNAPSTSDTDSRQARWESSHLDVRWGPAPPRWCVVGADRAAVFPRPGAWQLSSQP